MAEGGSEEVGDSTPDVFVSYASLDSGIAETACEALEKAGVTCWIAPRDVTPGAFYGDEIVHAIDAAKAIVLILSQHAAASPHVLREVERAASKRHTVISLRIDKAPLPPGLEYFLNTSQWLDASSGDTVRALPRLVSAAKVAIQAPAVTPTSVPSTHAPAPTVAAQSPKKIGIIVASAIGLGLLAFAADRLWVSRQKAAAPPDATAATSPSGVFSPPPHSIAVLPFVNMSGDASQAYFSDGLTEELLNSLSRINELQVAARTSSFSFQGEHPDIATVARKLNVAAVLEGSVRRSGHTVRITAQLVNGSTGYHLWSQTYDRDLRDVLALQTEIATAVAGALKTTLLGDVAAKIEMGGTRNPAAFDAYLRASHAYWSANTEQEEQSSIAAYSEAIRLDPNYALAFASRSLALEDLAWHFAFGAAVDGNLAKAQADANKALTLTPDLAEGHMALGLVLESRLLDYAGADKEYERAMTLAPGDARVVTRYGVHASLMGRSEAGLAAARRGIVLDPLNSSKQTWLCHQLFLARRYAEAITPCEDALAADPRDVDALGLLGLAHYALGDFLSARSSCEKRADTQNARVCLAIAYNKLGQRADAHSMVLKLRGSRGDAAAYHLARIYAQWGNAPEALEWLNTAMRAHSPWIAWLKTDPLVDPLRKEARFQAIERELKFPPL